MKSSKPLTNAQWLNKKSEAEATKKRFQGSVGKTEQMDNSAHKSISVFITRHTHREMCRSLGMRINGSRRAQSPSFPLFSPVVF